MSPTTLATAESLRPERPHPPVIFECTACLTTLNSCDRHIPVGWSQQGAATWCNDCTSSAETRVNGARSANGRSAIT